MKLRILYIKIKKQELPVRNEKELSTINKELFYIFFKAGINDIILTKR